MSSTNILRYLSLFVYHFGLTSIVTQHNKNDYHTTPIMTSARHGNIKILELLILLGADINARCLDGDNALMSAKRHNQIESFEMLKKANAHFGARNIQNQTVKDITSTEEFDFSGFFTFEDCLQSEIIYAKTQDLLLDADAKLEQLKRENFELNAKTKVLK